jgi:phenylacetate-CoA ligase
MADSGLIDPAHTLAYLTQEHHIPGKKSQISYMNTYASYLGELEEEGLQRGYRPPDFGLERISIGGELVSEGLKGRARRLFGAVEFDEDSGMTETWQLGGQRCSEGHIHFEPTMGMLEVLDPETGTPTSLGEAGTLVVTPFPPYRETTILLRYDTEDVVRPLEGPLTCELQNLQAITNLLGKLRFAVRHERGWTFPRDVLEALEGCEDVPLPARYGFWAVLEGVAVEVVARRTGPGIRRTIETHLEEHGVPVQELHVVDRPDALCHQVPLRCDLKEALFSLPSAQYLASS